jgi:hypothetical protein
VGTILAGIGNATKQEKFSPASTFISVIEYDPKEKTLDITFHSGSRFRYLQVDPTTYLSFKQSPTIDSYYSRAIKGNLQSVKLIDAGIGRDKSAPLKKVKEERTLNAGIKREQNRDKRIAGTVARAYADI